MQVGDNARYMYLMMCAYKSKVKGVCNPYHSLCVGEKSERSPKANGSRGAELATFLFSCDHVSQNLTASFALN